MGFFPPFKPTLHFLDLFVKFNTLWYACLPPELDFSYIASLTVTDKNTIPTLISSGIYGIYRFKKCQNKSRSVNGTRMQLLEHRRSNYALAMNTKYMKRRRTSVLQWVVGKINGGEPCAGVVGQGSCQLLRKVTARWKKGLIVRLRFMVYNVQHKHIQTKGFNNKKTSSQVKARWKTKYTCSQTLY